MAFLTKAFVEVIIICLPTIEPPPPPIAKDDSNLFQLLQDGVSVRVVVLVEEHEGIVFLFQNVLQHGQVDLKQAEVTNRRKMVTSRLSLPLTLARPVKYMV